MATKIVYVPYGVASTFQINLMNPAGTAFDNTITLVNADFSASLDGLLAAQLTNLPVTNDTTITGAIGYTVSLDAAETTGKVFNIQGVSANFWTDAWMCETTGHPLSQHPFRDINTGLGEGLTTGTPTTTVVATTITASAGANTSAGKILAWDGGGASYDQGRILSNTAGSNSTFTLETAVSVAPPTGVRIVIL